MPKEQIEEKVASKISSMPEDMINGLTKDEILDLLAFLEAGGYQLPVELRESKTLVGCHSPFIEDAVRTKANFRIGRRRRGQRSRMGWDDNAATSRTTLRQLKLKMLRYVSNVICCRYYGSPDARAKDTSL